jgi:hypothetical protein
MINPSFQQQFSEALDLGDEPWDILPDMSNKALMCGR